MSDLYTQTAAIRRFLGETKQIEGRWDSYEETSRRLTLCRKALEAVIESCDSLASPDPFRMLDDIEQIVTEANQI